jgi:dTDP-4-amino-4,6-dideoxygalactose transaminase
MRVPFCKPSPPPYEAVSQKIRAALETACLTKGPRLEELEEYAAELLGVKNVVAVSSCTAGLMLTLKALGLQGEVLVPSFTFIATGTSALWNNLRIRFVEIKETDCGVDVDDLCRKIGPRTSAVIATHTFGCPADEDVLSAVASQAGLPLIFDAAHGLGAQRAGKQIGACGTAQVFSLSPTKLATSGEGGLIAVNSAELAGQLRLLREYGNPGNYDCIALGMNARLAEIPAIIGLESLRRVEEEARRRNAAAQSYRRLLGTTPGIRFQDIPKGSLCSYKDFSIFIEPEEFGADRNQLARHLTQHGIETRAYFDPPLHRQTLFAEYSEPLSVTERVACQALSLPMYGSISEAEVSYVAESIIALHLSSARKAA